MTPERWQQVREMLEKALDLAPGERSAFLDRACPSDSLLRQEVETLLASNPDVRSSFLQSAPQRITLVPGTKLGDYEVKSLLGAGGMGEVYRACDSRLGRDVAIKVLPPLFSADRERLRRFEQEAQAAAALNHPNILAVFQMGTYEGAPYLVSELLEGETLREQINRGRLSVRKTIDYAVQIARGLAAAHEKGIVHRDLKPENLFVTKDGRVKILDFGLAKLMQPSASGHSAPTVGEGTKAGVVMGTVGYMSPEQVRGLAADHRADIFAFGAILYEMLAGERAFQKPTSAETMTAILNEDPAAISQITTNVPPGLQRVVHRCLEKSPEQRFQSASDLAFALEALSDSGSASVPVIHKPSRTRWVWAAVAGVVVALVATGIAWWRTPPAVPVVESVTQLTDDGEPKGLVMLTDGSRIYFNGGPPGSRRIVQVSVAGGPPATIETRLQSAVLGGVLRDGSALLAFGGTVSGRQESLWLIPLPAGEPRRLSGIETDSADIFPDGRIVFSKFIPATDAKGAARTDWFIADKDGTNPRKLLSLPGDVGDVLVEPDGQRILFTQGEEGNRRLFEIAADGTGLREIRKLNPDECCFDFTPDEKYLLYQSGNSTHSDIWALPMQTGILRRPGKPTRLTNGPLPYSLPTPSRDGKQIFALGTKQRGELVRYDMKLHQFLPFLSGISATDAIFSRDGKWVAYTAYPDLTLWRSRDDGTDRLQLTYAPMQAAYPSISPDGTKVAFGSSNTGELFVVDMEGGQPRRVSENGSLPVWSPDGNYLFFQSRNGAGGMIANIRTGKLSAVPSSERIAGFWFTRDSLIAPNEKFTNFITFNVETQKRTDIGPSSIGDIEHWMLSPDAKYLYFTTRGADPKAMRLRLADQRVEFITSLKDLHRAMRRGSTQINVAPDGSPVFTRDTGYQEIYALNVRWP